MKKAILVFDMPETCRECKLSVVDGYEHSLSWNRKCSILNRYLPFTILDRKQDDCPLSALPTKKRFIKSYRDNNAGFICGWNMCLEEILKENYEENK